MLKSTLYGLCVVFAAWAEVEVRESKLVNIVQGPVRGYKDSKSGIYDFQSIPYASAPTSSNRFKAPLPPPAWVQPLDAVDKSIVCPQSITHPAMKASKNIQENCLIANIYVPDTEEDNLPVVVYVHGGAFHLGFGNMIVPRKLVSEHNIIAVTFNYRLGVHGFLSLGTEDVPGNAGMKDQVALLRWVKKNIASFGGNPDDVTIAGFSTGAASVDLLMLSKSAEGLFNKVIPESGANVAAFTIQSDPLENAKWFAKILNFTEVDNIYALEMFYKTASFDLLTINSSMDRKDSTFLFSPCIERATSEEVFLDDSPVHILKSGNYKKVPLLYGFANMEGLLRIPFFNLWKHRMNEKFADFLPADLTFETDEQREKVSKVIKDFYFGDKPVADDNIIGFVNYFTDVMFAYPALRSVKYHIESGHDEIYLYEYSFVDDYTPFVAYSKLKGANHCAQTVAVLGEIPEYAAPVQLSKDFYKTSSTVRKIWANFIKTGKPVSEGSSLPQWPAVSRDWFPHMSISSELRLEGSLLDLRMRFWDDIYSQYYRDPVPAPAPSPRVCAARAEADEGESRLVNIAQGPVRGYKDADTGVYFFQSIPYASIPTGPNRFKAPLPPPTWLSPLEAVMKNIACPQATITLLGTQEIGNQQENCLIASVYVPDIPDENLPVVVYVHGGAFQIGLGDMLVPSQFVAENNIIAVTFNYRLGAHGFLCLGTEDIPGNAGMKDQVTALRWVKKNIASFGGNPDDITIAGYSAGSASVDLLMLSKSAEGLFNKVIPESGASIATWTIQSDPLENAKLYAKFLNFTNVDDINELENFYKTVSFDLLTFDSFFDRTDSTFFFSPCIERPTGDEVFLDKSPLDILRSGNYRKVPLLYGFSNMEGLVRILYFEEWKHKMNEKFSDFLPADLKFKSNEEKEKVAEQVKEFYFEDKLVGEDTVLKYIDFFSDVTFTYPMLRAVKYHVANGHDQIYLYEYSYVDENAPPVPHTTVRGAYHCAQTEAVFGGLIKQLNKNVTDISIKMYTTMAKLWGTFIKTGKPVLEGSSLPAWPAVGRDWSPHMALGNEISLQGALLPRRARFWDDIYAKYYRDPIPPPKPTLSSRSEL